MQINLPPEIEVFRRWYRDDTGLNYSNLILVDFDNIEAIETHEWSDKPLPGNPKLCHVTFVSGFCFIIEATIEDLTAKYIVAKKRRESSSGFTNNLN